MDISFIILTWNSAATLDECLSSVVETCTAEELSYEIFVVDNGSTDGKTLEIARAFLNRAPVRLIELEINHGTTVPRNMALRQATGDYICVMDSDAVIKSGRLRDVFELLNDESIGLIAPKLLLPSGEVQNSVKRFPSALSKLLKIPKIVFKIKIKDYDFYEDFPFKNNAQVDTAISATWFFKRDLIYCVGLLDEKIFYSPEDIDFCLRVRKTGKQLVYFPSFTVLHYTQQITHKKFWNRMFLSHFKGLTYYYWKHKYFFSPSLPFKQCHKKENGVD